MEIEEKTAKRNGIYWIIPIVLFIIFIMMVYDTSAFQNYAFKVKSWMTFNQFTSKSSEGNEKLELKSKNEINSIEDKLEKLMPPKPYIVVNTTTNRFSLRNSNGDTIRTGACSTGKDEILIIPNKKPIIFKTPKGIMTILNKRTSPVWTKPDWAFIEEGLPIPSARSSERIDNSTMGDYALGLGNGYYIHGTLYQRFLGLPVTHGCVRIGDADLEVIYNTLSVGSKVYIF
jgi:lipoprotein-anchoring transpeptidase ErfK/SrfK